VDLSSLNLEAANEELDVSKVGSCMHIDDSNDDVIRLMEGPGKIKTEGSHANCSTYNPYIKFKNTILKAG
jgi:hypothetical protein